MQTPNKKYKSKANIKYTTKINSLLHFQFYHSKCLNFFPIEI